MKSPKSARRGQSNAIPGTSKPIFEIDLPDQFRVQVRRLPKVVRKDVARTIDKLRGTFGRPHVHSGMGIRKLKRNYFECRVGLALRLIFRAEPGLLTFIMAGDHDDVKRYAKGQ